MFRLGALLGSFLLLLTVLTCKNSFPNKDDAKFQEVQKLFESIPKYPGSQEVGTSWDSKEVIARVGATYHVDADYVEVKRFYVATLERLSWEFGEERQLKNWFGSSTGYELSFSNGEFYVKLEYKGDKSKYGWDYALSVGWRYKRVDPVESLTPK